MSRRFGAWTVFSAGVGNGQRLQLAAPSVMTWDEQEARQLLRDLTEAVESAFPSGAGEDSDAHRRSAQIRPAGATWYRCQFCGLESLAAAWYRGYTCPVCKREYDPILAQDHEE